MNTAVVIRNATPGAALQPLSRADLSAATPNWTAMALAIARCELVDEVKDLSDKAMALRAYYAQSKDVENEAAAARVRLRAERRLGELIASEQAAGRLATQARHGRGIQVTSVTGDDTRSTLEDHDIPRNRSARAQQLARVPREQFEAALSEGKPSAHALAAMAPPRRDAAPPRPEQPPEVRPVLKTWTVLRDFAAAINDGTLISPPGWNEHLGLQPFQVKEIRGTLAVIQEYLTALQQHDQPAADVADSPLQARVAKMKAGLTVVSERPGTQGANA